MTTPRELVHRTLRFENRSRIPRQLWYLPWAQCQHPEAFEKIRRDFPDDIVIATYPGMKSSEGFQRRNMGSRFWTERNGTGSFHPIAEWDSENESGTGSRGNPVKLPIGDPYEPGTYVDVWGCRFTNFHRGVIGEVKNPGIKGENWEDRGSFRIPEEYLKLDVNAINTFCRNTDRFVLAGDWARPFERLQFLRGTEQLYVDLILKPKGMYEVLEEVHDYYCRLLECWAKTEVDALWFMDDWGAQQALLVHPNTWKELFKPLYREYIDIAHRNGKKIFMHSDGYILEIFPDLIDIGLDAINSQIFCMGVEILHQFRGSITFWGEIDRQHLLPEGTSSQIKEAVRLVKKNLWYNGGCIAQCEFGAGANPDNVYEVFAAWDSLVSS